jgi:hypothetical protein
MQCRRWQRHRKGPTKIVTTQQHLQGDPIAPRRSCVLVGGAVVTVGRYAQSRRLATTFRKNRAAFGLIASDKARTIVRNYVAEAANETIGIVDMAVGGVLRFIANGLEFAATRVRWHFCIFIIIGTKPCQHKYYDSTRLVVQ